MTVVTDRLFFIYNIVTVTNSTVLYMILLLQLRISQEDNGSVGTNEDDTVFNSQQSLNNTGLKEATPITQEVDVVEDMSHDLFQHSTL